MSDLYQAPMDEKLEAEQHSSAFPTKEQFEAYKRVQKSGRYNMVMDATSARLEAGLDEATYWQIISSYAMLEAEYSEVKNG